MTAQLAPTPIQKFFDNNGNPLFNGKLYSYVAGTSIPQATYTDSTMSTQNTNPIILNARGEANVWLDTTLSYKLVLQEANGTQIWAVDNIPGNGVFGTVQNIAALRNVTGVGVSNYQAIIVDGYTTAGDGGGGTFWWNSTSTVADNGGTIITPTGQSAGRWYRLIESYITPLMFGAVGNGTTDDSTAFSNAALLCGTYPLVIPYTSAGYLVNTPFSLPNNPTMVGDGLPLLFTTVAGNHICSGVGLSGAVTIRGILFQGANSSTVPTYSIGGNQNTSTGILTVFNCTDVRITNCGTQYFYNGLSVIKCSRVWVNDNYVSHWYLYGILGSLSNESSFDNNNVIGCDNAGASGSYGIMVTGDQTGGNPSKGISISFNKIQNVPSWDGIMSHDCNGLTIIGNDIRNVRNGIDLSYSISGLHLINLNVSCNYIEATTTNTWGSTGASSFAIELGGYDAANLIDTAIIGNNICRNFGNITGSTLSGSVAVIVASDVNDCVIDGNLIEGTGTIGGYVGIAILSTVNSAAVIGNLLRGAHPGGGIRLASAIAQTLTICGNTINQATVSDYGVYISGSTVSALSVGLNPTNSTTPFAQTTSTLTYGGQYIGAPVVAHTVLPYSASIAINSAQGTEFDITATNGTPFTINNPTNAQDGQRITITIYNTSGGVLGAVTWGSNFKLSAWTQPANGFNRSIDFRYGGSYWVQISQTGVDVPN